MACRSGRAASALERSLAAELTDHLGYVPGDPAGAGSGNNRNGSSPKRLATEVGPIDLDVPRDRNASFDPQTVRKGQRRLDGVDKLVIGLYARGMTVRDIQAQLKETFDLDLSHDLISKITDGVLEEVRDWQARPLDAVYPVIFLDAVDLQGPRRWQREEQGRAPGRRRHTDGKKEVLGIWVETTEGAKFWLRVLNEIRSRGVADVLIVVCDGLTGLPAAIETVWPDAVVQTCIVHLTRASLRWVNYKDRKKVAAQLRLLYGAPTEQAARDALDAWTDSEIGRQYPAIRRQWDAAWQQVIPFFAFPPEVRKVIYTTNMIESINYQLRKISKTRGHFPTDDALIKLLYLGCRELGRTDTRGRGGRATYNWKIALNQFDIMFPDRLDRT